MRETSPAPPLPRPAPRAAAPGEPRLVRYASFVKLEHTLFSLPLLVAGALVGDRAARAAGEAGLTPANFVLILLAGAGARTFALAVNRIVDRVLDAANPRTAARELPSGRLGLREAWGVALAGLAVYGASVAFLPPLCRWLSPLPILVFLGYPYLKRATSLCHLGVGLSLALAPAAAYLAVRGRWDGIEAALPLVVFAWLWVSGFDVIYATLDEAHDRAHGIHSLPARWGARRALAAAALAHLAAGASLAVWCSLYAATTWAWLLLGGVAALLVWQNRSADRVDLAFFRINAWLGFVVLAMVWAGLGAAPGGP